jgi:hypothetical protein
MDVLEWRGDSDDTTSGPACVNAGAHGDERRVRSTGASSRHGRGRFFTARLTSYYLNSSHSRWADSPVSVYKPFVRHTSIAT